MELDDGIKPHEKTWLNQQSIILELSNTPITNPSFAKIHNCVSQGIKSLGLMTVWRVNGY